LEQEFTESSKSPEEDIKQDIALPKDSSMVMPLSQSFPNEITTITQNHMNPCGDVNHLLEELSEEQRIPIQQE